MIKFNYKLRNSYHLPNCKFVASVSVCPINAHELVKFLIVFSYFLYSSMENLI